jgi:hypothetical protein
MGFFWSDTTMNRGAPVLVLPDPLGVRRILNSIYEKNGRKSKYRNIRTANGDGTVSDSRKEARIDAEFQLLLRAGQLVKVERKKRFPIIFKGEKICDYECDWCITDRAGNVQVIDAKGLKTAVYRLKKKLMKIINHIDIIER